MPNKVASGTPMARGLNFMLMIMMGLLILMCVGLFIFGILLLFSSELQNSFMEEINTKTQEQVSIRAIALISLTSAAMAGAYLYVVQILRAIVKTLLAGDPFVPENISRLRLVWIIIAATEIFRMCFHGLMYNPLTNVAEVAGQADDSFIDIRAVTWFLVFVIAALAEVFRHGAELRRDQQLTV